MEVRDITFQEPGDVDIDNKKANMEDVPYYFAGTHSLTGANISFLADENVARAVSFTIAPAFNGGGGGGGGIDAVCINDVADASKLEVKEKND